MNSTRPSSGIVATACLAVLLALPVRAEVQGPLDPSPVWPLCGRIDENPPMGWQESDGCPAERWGNPAFTDTPISSTYGPRLLFSEGLRYDFHRGIDIGCPLGTPVFAFADGVVRKAGPDPSYSDPLVQLRHYRPGYWGQCTTGGGCYHTNYLHMSGWAVAVEDVVSKGDLIGYSGASGSGNLQLALEPVDSSDPMAPLVHATITIPMSVELDLERVEVEVYERQPDHSMMYVEQPGETPVGDTVEQVGYWVAPPWFSMLQSNRQYTYKNSGGVPWSSFLQFGLYESPYWDILPVDYAPNIHLDAQHPDDFQVGLFNGVSIAPNHTNASSSEYVVRFGFLALAGTASAADLCVRLRALDVHGHGTAWSLDNCSPPPLLLTLDAMDVLWNATDLTVGYDVVQGDVQGLLSSAGDFAQATQGCLAGNIPQTSHLHGADPGLGEAFWYLVRPVLGMPTESYDSGGTTQAAPRDAGILASTFDCQ